MKTTTRFVLITTLALLAGVALWATLTQAAPGAILQAGGSPSVVAYQGEVQVSGAPYTGNGYFKFVVVNAAGNVSYWSNDGTSGSGTEPSEGVPISVSKGLFNVLLGDTSLSGMTQALTANVFNQPDRYLRVWFSSDNITFNRLLPDTPITAVPYALQAQEAVNADTLDGLHVNQIYTHYHNMVVVAKSGGHYTMVQDAIDSINGASADNPYLVWVAPGVYSETVTMKPNVHLQGAGQKVTIITSTASSSVWPPTQATLMMASDVTISDMTVGNGGTGDTNVALLATAGVTRSLVIDVIARAQGKGVTNYTILLIGSGTDVTLQSINALAENASSSNGGLLNYDGAVVNLQNGSFTGRGGEHAKGIFNLSTGSILEAINVTALAENGSVHNVAMSNHNGGVVTLRGGSFTGRGGNQADGVGNALNSTLTASNITVLAENGNENYGFGNYNGATATLHTGSTIARGGGNNYALSNELTATMKAEHVTALAENGSGDNYGLWNVNNSSLVLHSASLTGRGGTNAYGIANRAFGTTLEAGNVTALGENGSDFNYGLDNNTEATALLRGGSFTGYGGQESSGIHNSDSGTWLEVWSVTAIGENGTVTNNGFLNSSTAMATLHGGSFNGLGGENAYGIYNKDSGTTLDVESAIVQAGYSSTERAGLGNEDATVNVTQSVLDGKEGRPIYASSGIVTVSNSRLVGIAVDGVVTCTLVTRGTTVSTGSTCP